jgi:pimeloyl-ACP methyl ester carboxylesterase
VAGARLEFSHVGPDAAQAPCLVLLHEGLGCVDLWRDFPERLSRATGCGVFSYSRAGYGRSAPCTLPRPLDYMHVEAREVLPEVLRTLGLTRGLLVGHSDGASIAAIHAATCMHPGVRGLVLMAPHFFTEDDGLAAIARARQAYRHGDLRERLARHHGDNVDRAFRGWNDAWLDPGFTSFELRPLLPRIRIPITVIQGREDEYGSDAQVQAVERLARVPVRALRLARCGHAPQKDRPDAVLACVAGAVRGLLR